VPRFAFAPLVLAMEGGIQEGKRGQLFKLAHSVYCICLCGMVRELFKTVSEGKKPRCFELARRWSSSRNFHSNVFSTVDA